MEAKIRKVPLLITIAVIVALVMLNLKAFGAEARPTVIFLVGHELCAMQLELAEMTPYDVACAREDTLVMARAHYYGFEEYFNTVYLVMDSPNGKLGQAYYDSEKTWAFAAYMPYDPMETVNHELEHLFCECFYTLDGYHGSPQTGAVN